MTYAPVDTRIYNDGEVVQARDFLVELHEECRKGHIDQHASPALLIAIDVLAEELNRRGVYVVGDIRE